MTQQNSDFTLEDILDEERNIMNCYAPDYRNSTLFNSLFYQMERKRFIKWMLKTIRKSGQKPTTLSYLDCGCGNGENFQLLYQAGCKKMTGLDIAERMLEKDIHADIPGLELINGSIEKHDFGEEKFDVVMASFTVHHLYDDKEFFQLVERVLKSGGWFFIWDYNKDAWFHLGVLRKITYDIFLAPIRFLFKLKNKKKLSQLKDVEAKFNKAHHFLTYPDIISKTVNPESFEFHRYTHSMLSMAFNYALAPNSKFDQAFHQILEWIDLIAIPFHKGIILGVGGRKK